MARNTTPAPDSREVFANNVVIAEEVNATNQLGEVVRLQSEMQARYGQERDLLNQLLGQAQMADAIGKFTATVAVSKMAFVKENKLYQQLKGAKDRDGRDLDGTWEDFCKLLGTSAPKVNEDIHNLQSFGEQALESMSAMGIGYRAMRQYRKLPEDQKQALLEAAKSGDKGEFLDLAEELIAKHAKEKETLTQAVEEGQREREAIEKRIEVIRQQRQQDEMEEDRFAALSNEGKLAELQAQATSSMRSVCTSLLHLRRAMEEMQEVDSRTAPFLAGLLKQVGLEMKTIEEEMHLPKVNDLSETALEWIAYQEAEDRKGIVSN